MKVQKYEISRTIDKLKSIVQKNDQFPALGGVLVKDGYLIASNTEMTMQLKLEASKGSCFIIPMKAFDVIKNLPDGEVIIDADGKNIVTIKTKAIKNKYQSYPPEEFSFDITEDLDAPEVVINGKRMMEAIGHVIYAAADSSSATQMMGVYFEGGENKIKLVALDGHVVAVDSIPTDGTADMKLIVPKTVAKKLVSMGIIDDVAVTYTKNRAVFKSKEYTIYTRLIEGKYFDYDRFFMAGKMKTYVSRPELVAAMTRAKMCTEEKKPAVFEMNEDQLNIRIADRLTDYQEEGSISFVKFHLDKSHPFIGKALKEIVLPPELLVVLIIRGKELLVPNGGTILEQGDLLIAAAEEFEDRRNMTLQEVTVDKNYKWNGKYLHEITIPGGTLIVMIRRGTSTIIPAGDTKVCEGDVLVLTKF